MEQKTFDEYLMIMEFMGGTQADSPLLKKYKESWDELMPIVKAVMKFMAKIDMKTKGDTVMIFYHNLPNVEIDQTYEGVIRFLNDYKELWQSSK